MRKMIVMLLGLYCHLGGRWFRYRSNQDPQELWLARQQRRMVSTEHSQSL